jgi:beta-lactamase class A
MRLSRDKTLSVNQTLAQRHAGARKGRWLAVALAGAAVAGLASYAFGNVGAGGGPQLVLDLTQLIDRTPPPFAADCSGNPAALQTDLAAIAAAFPGDAGIAVTKVGCDWVAGARLDRHYPQQSVSKLWVSIAALQAVDRGRLRLDQPLQIRVQDLTLFNQPLRYEVLEKGQIERPVLQLMQNAMSLSDNTANDRLLWTLGGPDRIRQMLRDAEIAGIRFGPGERLLQSKVAGLEWQPELSLGSNFEQARARLPKDLRQAALDRYLADPMDGATPTGMVQALAKLAKGELLSQESTQVLLDIMARSRSGPMRLKAGFPPGWKVYHKTGTGQELGGLATGYNDVALVQAPDGAWYALAVLIGATRQPVRARMEMMQSVSAALTRWHETRTS